MANTVDVYIEQMFPAYVAHVIDDALEEAQASCKGKLDEETKASIAERMADIAYKKAVDALHFFTTIDPRKGPEMPLERMAAPFEHLSAPQNAQDAAAFHEAMKNYASEFVKRAFDQHLDNPEQYVSHGFDHSINVANYTREVLKMNPEIVRAMRDKYAISEGEATFMLEAVSLLHDCGYPCVGHRSKVVHGIAGADLVLALRPYFVELITSPQADREHLFNDFRKAILFHSADKVEEAFNTKVVTTLGTFLTDHHNIVQVLSSFYDPTKNPSGTPREALVIYVQNPEVKNQLEETLKMARQDSYAKLGVQMHLPEIKVHQGLFKGRFADLEFSRDRLLGLEFSMTDLLTSPLSVIRLVDNMDMRQTRLTPVQNEPAFREIYHTMGDLGETSQLFKYLENLDQEVAVELKKAKTENEQKVIHDKYRLKGIEALQVWQKQMPRREPFEERTQLILHALNQEDLAALQTPNDARKLLTRVVVDSILQKRDYQALDPHVKQMIRTIGLLQSSHDLCHFGGCESIQSIALRGIRLYDGSVLTNLAITVDSKQFEHLNRIKVTEKSTTEEGETQSVTVGVGEYQIWRASEAYRSIFLGGRHIELSLQDENAVAVPIGLERKL